MSKGAGRQNWRRRQQRDPYVRRARLSHYRSRAVYKLMEIDQGETLLAAGQNVIELGAAPGGWSQYVSEKIGAAGHLLALDLLPMVPVGGNVTFIAGDATAPEVQARCLQAVKCAGADLFISDMAPNLSGIRAADQARSLHLAEVCFELATKTLKQGGALLLKIFEGEGVGGYRRELEQRFQRVVVRKPGASRDESREFYVLARGFRV